MDKKWRAIPRFLCYSTVLKIFNEWPGHINLFKQNIFRNLENAIFPRKLYFGAIKSSSKTSQHLFETIELTCETWTTRSKYHQEKWMRMIGNLHL